MQLLPRAAFERPVGRVDRAVDVFGAAAREPCEHGSRRRVGRGERLARGGVHLLPVDDAGRAGVGEDRLGSRRQLLGPRAAQPDHGADADQDPDDVDVRRQVQREGRRRVNARVEDREQHKRADDRKDVGQEDVDLVRVFAAVEDRDRDHAQRVDQDGADADHRGQQAETIDRAEPEPEADRDHEAERRHGNDRDVRRPVFRVHGRECLGQHPDLAHLVEHSHDRVLAGQRAAPAAVHQGDGQQPDAELAPVEVAHRVVWRWVSGERCHAARTPADRCCEGEDDVVHEDHHHRDHGGSGNCLPRILCLLGERDGGLEARIAEHREDHSEGEAGEAGGHA